MDRPRPLVGHALVSLGIVVGSILAMTPALSGVRVAREPVATSAIVPAPLSGSGRLAYWRPSPGDDLELWVSDLDGKRRFPIATVPKDADPDLTRWSPDGDAVAWRSGREVHVARLDRTRVTVSVPDELRAAGWRPVGFEWSPSSRRLAASLRAAHGYANESDVFVADLDVRATTWSRRTSTADSLAGPWIDDERILTESMSATVGILAVDGERAARPLTAMNAVSPQIRPDGRVWVFGGRGGWQGLFSGPLGAGTVWSMTIDGDDLRRESQVQRDQGRLHTVLPDGRPVVGAPGALFVLGEEALLFPWRSGAVRRVAVSRDGRHVIAITESRVLRVDPSKIPRAGSTADVPADAAAVLLDGVRAADAWFPSRPVALARSPTRPAGPREDLTFTFGRSLWRMGRTGEMRLLADTSESGLGTLSGFGWVSSAVPSPDGSRIAAAMYVPRSGDGRPEPKTIVVDRDGRSVTTLGGSPGRASWSRDGTHLALTGWSETSGVWTEIHDARTWSPVARYEGARGAWSGAGLVLVTEGRPHPTYRGTASWLRVGQSVDLVSPWGRRTITDADRLAAHPMLRDLPRSKDAYPWIGEGTPSPSGGHVIVVVNIAGPDGSMLGHARAVVRASDGQPLSILREDPAWWYSAFMWSPTTDLLGVTRAERGVADPTSPQARRAVVLDVAGRTVLEREGSFAGWSADGEGFYLARSDGLYAVPLGGGDEVRVSALGVATVAATRP
jgi:hypothetical protein